jgi:hypothetical protein
VTYAETLAATRKVGAAHATDAQLMALFCDAPLQTLVGAVSPQLVWEGAQHTGMTSAELAKLCADDLGAVAELMWAPPL